MDDHASRCFADTHTEEGNCHGRPSNLFSCAKIDCRGHRNAPALRILNNLDLQRSTIQERDDNGIQGERNRSGMRAGNHSSAWLRSIHRSLYLRRLARCAPILLTAFGQLSMGEGQGPKRGKPQSAAKGPGVFTCWELLTATLTGRGATSGKFPLCRLDRAYY